MCRLKTFCFRFSLRSGAIAAAVHTAIGLVSMLGYGICVIYLAYYYDYFPYHSTEKPALKDGSLILYIVGGVFLLVTLLKLISLIALCVGINKNRASSVLIWIIWTGIEFFLLPCLITVTAILTGDWWVFLGLLYVLCMFYLYCATCCYYTDLVHGIVRPSPL